MRYGAFVLLISAAALVVGQEAEFVNAAKLGAAMDSGKSEAVAEFIARPVAFQDELLIIHRDTEEFPGYMKFDTLHVRCRIRVNEIADRQLLTRYALGHLDTLKGQKFKDKNLELIRQILFEEHTPHKIYITGEVTEPPEYSDLNEQAIMGRKIYIFDVEEVQRPFYNTPKPVER
ncbi:MAG: hypothetical protein DRP63_08560 [Planctomycetota bacterium]|nr:MAG: hypothetical protein DRP63_08560 [Planctomycetota bacterium]